MENNMEIPLKTRNSCIMIQQSHSWAVSEKNSNSKRYMHSNIYSSTSYNIQDIEATQMSINKQMDKDVAYIYIYMYIYIMEYFSWI